MAVIVFLLGGLYGITSFGTSPLLRRVFLPNASCRYIEPAPTYCYYYPLQTGLTTGYSGFFIEAIFLVLIVIALVLILGRIWCSWLCPFGFSQELLSDLRNKLNIPPLRMKWTQRVLLRQVKYAILFFTVLISISIGISSLGLTGYQSTLTLPYCQVCPANGFFTVLQQIGGILPWTTSLPLVAIFMLLFFLVTSFATRMFWCRVCPMGGLMAIFASRSLMWLHKDADKCTKCRICLRVCPLDHDKVYEEMETGDVGGEDCTLCGRCIEMCPEKDCLSLNFLSKRLGASKKPKLKGIGKKAS
jgi:polyferredoxin